MRLPLDIAARRSRELGWLAIAVLLAFAVFQCLCTLRPALEWLLLAPLGAFAAVAAGSAWHMAARATLARTGARGFTESPGAAAAAWLVPLLNLAVPLEAAQETWKAASRESGAGGRGWGEVPPSRFITGWWVLVVASGLGWYLAVFRAAASRWDPGVPVTTRAEHMALAAAALLGAICISRIEDAMEARVAAARAHTRPAPPPDVGGASGVPAYLSWAALVLIPGMMNLSLEAERHGRPMGSMFSSGSVVVLELLGLCLAVFAWIGSPDRLRHRVVAGLGALASGILLVLFVVGVASPWR